LEIENFKKLEKLILYFFFAVLEPYPLAVDAVDVHLIEGFLLLFLPALHTGQE
jgi:hypothetical protein